MHQLNILLSISGIAAALYFCFFNLIRGNKFQNRLFALICFISCFFFGILFLQAAQIELLHPEQQARIFAGLILVLSALVFYLILLYPEQIHKRKRILLFFTVLPPLAASPVAAFTDFMKINVIDVSWSYLPGAEMNLFLLLIGIYLTASMLILNYRSRTSSYLVIKRELFYISNGLALIIILLLLIIFLTEKIPVIFDYRIIAISICALFILTILNRSINDISSIDIKRLYLSITYGAILFILMAVPVYAAFYFSNIAEVYPAISAVLIIAYLITFYKFIKPVIDQGIWKGYRNLTERFTETLFNFGDITAHAADANREFWDDFFRSALDQFMENFNISGGCLYLYDENTDNFILRHSYVKTPSNEILEKDNPLVMAAIYESSTLDKKKLIFEDKFQNIKEPALEIMNENDFQVILPLFDNEGKPAGFTAFSGFNDNAYFSRTFLKALDLYRIQFQYQLSNGLFLEKVKTKMVVEHDKNAVNLIKKKVIPSSLRNISNIRLASFFIDNNNSGGDYFDSSPIDENRLLIMAADTGRSGIDSGLVYLQLYSILHGFSKTISSPERLLNRANEILFTLENRDAGFPACILLVSGRTGEIHYSSAAFNPLMIYRSSDNNFSEYDQRTVPLTAGESYVYSSEKIIISRRDIGILFSDGLPALKNSNGEKYQLDRMKKVISRNHHESPAVIVRKIYKDLKEFSGDTIYDKDITLLLFKVS